MSRGKFDLSTIILPIYLFKINLYTHLIGSTNVDILFYIIFWDSVVTCVQQDP